MTIAAGVYGPFLRDMGNNDKAFDLSADTIKYVLLADTYTPDFNTDDEYADVSADETTGTGYTTGGEALVTNAWAIGSGYATFTAADTALATTTLTGVHGTVLIDDSLTGDPLIVCIPFASAYNTVAAPFEITWDAAGIWRADYII